jgi:hypothetical protein
MKNQDKIKDMLERLKHFETHQLEAGDEYGAEVLYRAGQMIQELEGTIVDMCHPEFGSVWLHIDDLTRDINKAIKALDEIIDFGSLSCYCGDRAEEILDELKDYREGENETD